MYALQLYNKVIFKMLTMRRQNAKLNKGIALRYDLVAVYLKGHIKPRDHEILIPWIEASFSPFVCCNI